MVKISVIIPVYKVEPYLCRCIDSILSQSYKDFELILVDDGSPDNCGKICDEYVKKDARVRVVHKQNGGQSSARNVGLDVAKGEYITFVDSDDFVHPQMLELLVYGLEKTKSDLSMCYIQSTESSQIPSIEIDFDAYILKSKREYWHTGYEGLPAELQFVMCMGKLYRRSCIVDLRFPEGMVHEDVVWASDYTIRLNATIVYDAPLYYYYQRPGSTMHTSSAKSTCDFLKALIYKDKICSSHFPEYENENQMHFLRSFFKAVFWGAKLDGKGKQIVKKWIIKNRRAIKNILKQKLTFGQKLTFLLYPILSTKLFYLLFEYRFDLCQFLFLHLNKKKN